MEAENFPTATIVISLVIGGLLLLFLRVFDNLLLKPKRKRSKLTRQGIRGPAPSALYGNIEEMKTIIQKQKQSAGKSLVSDEKLHAWPPIVFPHFEQWSKEYGPTFLYSTGNLQILCITDPEMVKEISLCTSINLGKPTYLSTERGPLLGRGILSSNGPYWAHQKNIIAPEFYMDKVKGLVSMMAESTSSMLQNWERKAECSEGKVEITVDEDLRRLTADMISRACFGSRYDEGEKIFTKLLTLQRLMSKGNIGVPGLRYLPNKYNREVWKLQSDIDSMILEVVKGRREDNNKKDLLQSLLNAAERYGDESNIPVDTSPTNFIVDNCKNIYLAGHETTASSATWCLMTMAAHPEWQVRARAEVLEACGDNIPTADMLRGMKVLTTVIQETLRLYPPVAYIVRQALEDINVGNISIPKGINLQVPIPILHQHENIWGTDAHEFKPDRFANGITGACKIPQAYLPFGAQMRICVGQHFAMAELKVILSLVLSKFSFSLSPAYQHSPIFRLIIQPENGVRIQFQKL